MSYRRPDGVTTVLTFGGQSKPATTRTTMAAPTTTPAIRRARFMPPDCTSSSMGGAVSREARESMPLKLKPVDAVADLTLPDDSGGPGTLRSRADGQPL